MKSIRVAGAIAGATVITSRLEAVVDPYRALGLKPVSDHPGWGGLPRETEARVSASVYLASGDRPPWLRLVEIREARDAERFARTGWFSLEVGTEDVAALAVDIDRTDGFERLAGPAPLDVAPDILAMQVAGPSGELYYFTQIRQPLPPFDLPVSRARIDRLFIAVQTTPDRAASLAFWEPIAGRRGESFDTRIGILSRGLGLQAEHRVPVGVVQLPGQTLIEIDQIPGASVPEPGDMACGITMVSLHGEGPARVVRGPAGEWVECRDQAAPVPQPR